MNNKMMRKAFLVTAAVFTAGAAWAAPGGGPANLLALLLGLGAGMTAFVVWGRCSFPQVAAAADRTVAGASAWKTFWIGLINALVAFLLVALFGKLGQAAKPFGLLALAVIGAVLVVGFRGALAVWPSYGSRVLGTDEAPSDLQTTLAGGALLTGISLLFPIGLVFSAYVLMRSLGAGVLMQVRGTKVEAAPSTAA